MSDQDQGVIVTTADRTREAFEAPERGDVTWFTLFSGDITPTDRMSAGVAEFEPGSRGLMLHRHEQAEIYYIVSGTGTLTIEGVVTSVEAGTAVFIPGNAEHGIRNAGRDVLRLFYVFPTDRFSDVDYRFSAPEDPAPVAALRAGD